ncbi:MAG TPA: alpha/beta family hydrolase [Terriglobales bacterium]|nr:alpha/beta family hydrolase [Terriglobales bacterium]
MAAAPYENLSLPSPVRGFLNTPAHANGCGLVLTHGAGANCHSPLLRAVEDVFVERGYSVLRCDLAFRQQRRFGPPRNSGRQDRESLRSAVLALAEIAPGPVFLGGHSYGGRQASMLAAEDPALCAGLLLLSYPLHPPQNPGELRTAHFPSLRTPTFCVHGSRDPFAAPGELAAAVKLIPAPVAVFSIANAGHDLGFGRAALRAAPAWPLDAAAAFQTFIVASCACKP